MGVFGALCETRALMKIPSVRAQYLLTLHDGLDHSNAVPKVAIGVCRIQYRLSIVSECLFLIGFPCEYGQRLKRCVSWLRVLRQLNHHTNIIATIGNYCAVAQLLCYRSPRSHTR